MIRRFDNATRTATGYALSVAAIGAAVVGFPAALAAGVGLYVAMRHTPSGRASMDLLDTLADIDVDVKGRGPSYRRGFADGRLAERADTDESTEEVA